MRTLVFSLRAIVAAALFVALPAQSLAQLYVGVGISVPPPAIPVYQQPMLENPNYMWTPGYWAWGSGGYYWVPGTWVAAPQPGLYWTPGYWAFDNGAYYWNNGFWAPQVGFYGGINYGFGYYGNGFVGGMWNGPAFSYNTAVMTVDRTVVRRVYVNKTVITKTIVDRDRTSFNGGDKGVQLRPTPAQLALRRSGMAPTSVQREHEQVAAQDRHHLATVNNGHPEHGAMAHPLDATHP